MARSLKTIVDEPVGLLIQLTNGIELLLLCYRLDLFH